jgi:hypothetical protein
MSLKYTWKKTTPEVYRYLRHTHWEEMQPFATITNLEGNSWLGERHIMTEWGFKGADAPIVKVDERGSIEKPEVTYWLAFVTKDDTDA